MRERTAKASLEKEKAGELKERVEKEERLDGNLLTPFIRSGLYIRYREARNNCGEPWNERQRNWI